MHYLANCCYAAIRVFDSSARGTLTACSSAAARQQQHQCRDHAAQHAQGQHGRPKPANPLCRATISVPNPKAVVIAETAIPLPVVAARV